MSNPEKQIKTKKSKSSFGGSEISMVVMAAPFLILFFLFTVLPVLVSLFLSFCSYDMLSSPKFIGLDNFLRMFVTDDMFVKITTNTLVLAVATAPAGFLLSNYFPFKLGETVL